jgi:hypothetical protein
MVEAILSCRMEASVSPRERIRASSRSAPTIVEAPSDLRPWQFPLHKLTFCCWYARREDKGSGHLFQVLRLRHVNALKMLLHDLIVAGDKLLSHRVGDVVFDRVFHAAQHSAIHDTGTSWMPRPKPCIHCRSAAHEAMRPSS